MTVLTCLEKLLEKLLVAFCCQNSKHRATAKCPWCDPSLGIQFSMSRATKLKSRISSKAKSYDTAFAKKSEKSELERCCIFFLNLPILQYVAITETCNNSMQAWATILQARAELKQNGTSLSCLALREPRNRPCVACCPCAMLSGLLDSCPSLAVKDRSRFSRLWRRREEVEKLDEIGVVSVPPCSTIFCYFHIFSPSKFYSIESFVPFGGDPT